MNFIIKEMLQRKTNSKFIPFQSSGVIGDSAIQIEISGCQQIHQKYYLAKYLGIAA